jgi:rod shape-determining protein MreC
MCLIIGLSLFIGTEKQRLSKSKWLSSTLFFPFAKSLKIISLNHFLEQENKHLTNELMKTVIENNLLLQQIKKTELFGSDFPEIDFILIEIIGFGAALENATLLANKGEKDGIYEHAPVLTPNGILGKVIQTTKENSVILPYHHPSFKVAVMTKTIKVQGILESEMNGNTYMSLLQLNDEISIGDTIVTSHLSEIFPMGYGVGTVKKILTSHGKVHKKALIQRFVEPERVNYAAILKNRKVKNETSNH